MEIGNQMQNHKIETNRELLYEDGIIWLTLIFIKIIGSDTLWFPLPPSEVLSLNTVIIIQSKYSWIFLLWIKSDKNYQNVEFFKRVGKKVK